MCLRIQNETTQNLKYTKIKYENLANTLDASCNKKKDKMMYKKLIKWSFTNIPVLMG